MDPVPVENDIDDVGRQVEALVCKTEVEERREREEEERQRQREVLGYYRGLESNRRPVPNFLETVQDKVTPTMRAILTDWLCNVGERYNFCPTTIHLSVSYLDLYLSRRRIKYEILQLVGILCLVIASKYEEVVRPQFDVCLDATENDNYSPTGARELESTILKVLNWDLGNPTPISFLWSFLEADKANTGSCKQLLQFLSTYLAELTLLDYDCVQFLPTKVAASAIFVAKYTLTPTVNPWTLDLQLSTGYKPSDLKECVRCIIDLQSNNKHQPHVFIRNKYKQRKYMSVSEMPSHIFPSFYLQDADAAWRMGTIGTCTGYLDALGRGNGGHGSFF